MMPIVRVEDLFHRSRRRLLDPFEPALLETVSEEDLLAHHQPRDLSRVPRFRIRAVVRSILRNAFENFACGGGFLFPEFEEQRLLVHLYLLARGGASPQRASGWGARRWAA